MPSQIRRVNHHATFHVNCSWRSDADGSQIPWFYACVTGRLRHEANNLVDPNLRFRSHLGFLLVAREYLAPAVYNDAFHAGATQINTHDPCFFFPHLILQPGGLHTDGRAKSSLNQKQKREGSPYIQVAHKDSCDSNQMHCGSNHKSCRNGLDSRSSPSTVEGP